jgi:O-antigen/teichoic acid export membrane protein
MLDHNHHTVAPGRLSLKRRVFNASAWAFVGNGFILTVRFGSNLLMTRLLAPEMFGIMTIGSIVLVALAMVSDLGLKQSIVRSQRGHDPAFLNTAWVVQIAQGGFLWLAALAISTCIVLANQVGAFPLGSVYADPILPYVIAVLSSGVLIAGLGSTKAYEASRQLTLGRLVQIEIVSQIASLVLMLAWVSIDRSIWALVSGALFGTVARTCLSHFWLAGSANRWHWDRSAFQEMLHFGKWMFLSSILGFLVNNGDRVLLGGMIDTTLLGVYSIAYLMFSVIEQVLATLIGEVVFPAVSEILRERRGDLKDGYYGFQMVVASLTYASAGFLMGAGDAIVTLLYDHRYLQAGWMLQILAAGLLAVPWRSASLCFMALGQPQILSYTIAVRLVVLGIAAPLGFHALGIEGAIWGIVMAQLSAVPVIVVFMIKNALLDIRKELLLLLIVPLGVLVAKVAVLAIGLAGLFPVAVSPQAVAVDRLPAHVEVHGELRSRL